VKEAEAPLPPVLYNIALLLLLECLNEFGLNFIHTHKQAVVALHQEHFAF
jgi:hypothetical protein